MTAIVVLLYLLSFLVIWQFVGYPLFTALVVLLVKPKNKSLPYEPFVSIIVPAFNEEKVIARRIDNLLQLEYPKNKYEIIIVESGSSDKTYQIAEEYIGKRETHSTPQLKLIKEAERNGKASAINLGKNHAQGNIVLVTDANCTFDSQVLREMMPHFENPKIGAVGGRYIVSNPENSLASSESFYWDMEYLMRRGESSLESACLFHGEINAWRKSIVTADTRMLSEDLDMVIQIKRAGYRIQYEPKAMVYEPSATTSADQIKQRKRTTIGTLQCILKHRTYLLLPRELYSLMIFPSHKSLTMLSPFIILAIPLLYIISHSSSIIIPHLITTIVAFSLLFGILMLLMPRLIERKNTATRISLSSLPKVAYYVLLNEYIILLAWKDFLFGKYSVIWEKAESTR